MGRALVAVVGGAVVGLAVWALLQRLLGPYWDDAVRQLRRVGVRHAEAQAIPLPRRPARYSDLPFLRQSIMRFSPTSSLVRFLEQSGVRMTVSVLLLLTGCCGFAAYWLLGFAPVGPLTRLLLAAGAALIPVSVLAKKRANRFKRLSTQLPDALRMISSGLRAGLGLEGGLAIVANELPDPIRSEFRKLLNETQLYGNLREALVELGRRVPLADYRLFATSASLHRDIGGNFAVLLDRLERTVRDRLQLNRELQTLTAEGRMSGWVVGMLPVVVGVVIYLMNPAYFQVLTIHPTGRTLLGAGIGLEVLGFVIIRWMTTPKIT